MAVDVADTTIPLKNLTRGVRRYNRWANLRGIEAAYAFSEKVHAGQERASGAPVFSHPTHVAETLVGLRMDTPTIAAGLLHDVLEDTRTTYAELEEEFGEEIARLVEGVTKIGQVKRGSSQEAQAENLRKMIVATAQDVRVLLIKLADRLHNMRTIEYLNHEKAVRISRETLDIYAPLANRLGMGRIKRELEDYAFRQIEPDVHETLQGLVAKDEEARHNLVESYCTRATRILRKAGIKAEVTGRPKHLYSIHQKMQQQHKAFEDINDLNAIRVLVPSIQDCYHALGILHTTWTPVPGRFKDYVAVPKMNMYQSLHTTVVVEGGERLEVQIRTHDMHKTAQLGIAAHWRYKEGTPGDEGDEFDQRMDWLRQMLEWQTEAEEPREFMEQLKTDLLPSSVYAFTPKGRLIELPYGATPIDFAYAIHSEIGDRCSGAKINGRLVPLRTPLRQGDEVEIITNAKQRPKHDWLEWAQTGRARSKIRRYLRQQHEQEPKPEAKSHAAAKHESDMEAPEPRPVVTRRSRSHGDSPVIVEGSPGYLVRFAKCCNPLPGEAIAGYVTRNNGVSVHRANCRSLEQLHKGAENRRISVEWADGDNRGYFTAGLRVQGKDRPNLLADVLGSFGNDHVNLAACNAYRDKLTLSTTFDLILEVEDQAQLARVLNAIRKVPGVTGAERSSTITTSQT